MAGPLNATVVLAKCSKTKKFFGMRVEKRGNDWVRTWAFPIDESVAKREGFDAAVVTGSFIAVDNYPGCPHCKAVTFCKCYCGKIGCTNGLGEYTCPWCEASFVTVNTNSQDISGGGY